MPTLDEISYDREATIAAVRDFYEFLTKMFLPESWIIYPPPEGWPSITNERMRPLGKTDEVIELMRRLPYLHVDAKVAPDTAFADWQSGIDPGELDEGAADGIRTITEGADYEDIPASAFGLTCGGRNTMAMVLDTRFGIVHWEDCPVSSSKAIREPVDDDFDDCTPENEHIWRSNTAWTIPDFFEVLKNEYRVLNYVPLHEGQVDEWVKDGDGDDDADANQSGRGVMLRSVKRVYREHGWPDLSVYSKDECLKAVEKLIRDRFPDEAWIFVLWIASKIAYDLMGRYTGNRTGDVPGNLPSPYYWWEAGAMFGEMVEYWYYTGDTTYNAEVLQALQHQRGQNNNYEPKNQTSSLGNDDQMFWAFAVMGAAELGFDNPPDEDPSWLALAQAVFNRQTSRWDSKTCGGGLRWQMVLANVGYDYKNSVTNLGLFQLSARLGRYTGNQTYIDWANKIYDWYESTSLYDAEDYMIYDGAHTNMNCTDASREQWSYTYGMLTAGMAYLYNHTENDMWLNRIDGLLNRTFDTFFPAEMGPKIMVETTCEPLGVCNNDQRSFKAYLSQWLARTAQLVPARFDTIMPYLRVSAVGAAGQCGTDGKNCGHEWNTTVYDGTQGVGEQMSALAIVQVMMLDNAQLTPPYTATTGGTSKSDPSAGTDGSDVGAGGAGDGTGISHISTREITTGDRVGAGVLTAGVLSLLLGGTTWLIMT